MPGEQHRKGAEDVIAEVEAAAEASVESTPSTAPVEPGGADTRDVDDSPAAVLGVEVPPQKGGEPATAPSHAAPAPTPSTATPATPGKPTADEVVTVNGVEFRKSVVGETAFAALRKQVDDATTWRSQAQHWAKLNEERRAAQPAAPKPEPKPFSKEELYAAARPHVEKLLGLGLEPDLVQELPGLAAHLGLGDARITRAELVTQRLLQVLCAAQPDLLDAFADLVPETVFEPIQPIVRTTREQRQAAVQAQFRDRYNAALDRIAKSHAMFAGLADEAARGEFTKAFLAEFNTRKDDPFEFDDARLEVELRRLYRDLQREDLEAAFAAQQASAAAAQQRSVSQATGSPGGGGGRDGRVKVNNPDIREVLDS